jgi:hypothetical protein
VIILLWARKRNPAGCYYNKPHWLSTIKNVSPKGKRQITIGKDAKAVAILTSTPALHFSPLAQPLSSSGFATTDPSRSLNGSVLSMNLSSCHQDEQDSAHAQSDRKSVV